MKRIRRIIIGLVLVVGIIALGIYAWKEFAIEKSNPNNYTTIGDIPTPDGYERIDCDDPEYGNFLKSLPLKPKGAIVKYYLGTIADLQDLNYAVVDLPLLSNAEQCADVCMRLRAEYLYSKGRYSDIHFLNVQGKVLKYSGGESRKEFEDYLRHVFDVANTYSLDQEMSIRKLSDIQPGDVFVYPATSQRYGHAVMVADVARNPETGGKAIMLVEGFMPARSIHILQNWRDSSISPWFILDEEGGYLTFALFEFNAANLKYFSE